MEDVLWNLPRKTSAGDDQISYIGIKDAMYYVAPMLKTIINLIIETSHWPKVWSNGVIFIKGKGKFMMPPVISQLPSHVASVV